MSELSPGISHIPSGTVHRTIGLLHGALARLKADVPNERVEWVGVVVHRAMSTQQRSFHTAEHIFDLSDPDDPHTTLAAIFHDIVYYQVDDGFLPEIEDLLSPYIEVDERGVSIRGEIDRSERAFWGCASIFGFQPGDTLSPFGGLNEFLSALVMDLLFIDAVSDVDLLIATASIEATIPFRGPDAEGRRPPERLAKRVKETNDAFNLGLDEKGITNAVVAAVCFSNRDVENFAEDDPGRFLDNTWKLLPESNPSLRFRGLYTVDNYALALMKMEGFLSSLKPESVFHTYEGFPKKDEYASLIARTTLNLSTAERYLGVKMISTGILKGLAHLTGGDTPVAFFMGDLNPKDKKSTLATFLPAHPPKGQSHQDESDELYRLLKHGRASASRFDLKNSPLSLYVHRCLDDETQIRCIAAVRSFIKGDTSPEEFLSVVPGHLVATVARATAELAFTRRDQLLAIADRYAA
jgi:hypothetical protein